MGYNSGIFILNDAMHLISEDPAAWWRDVMCVLSSGGSSNDRYGPSLARFGTEVFHVEHADYIGVYAIGGNYISLLGMTTRTNQGHSSPEDKVRLIKEIAGSLGYNLVKKRSKSATA